MNCASDSDTKNTAEATVDLTFTTSSSYTPTDELTAPVTTNLIVNYLPQMMSDDEFKRLFESIGPLESCKLIKNKQNQQSLCYGFVNFVDQEDACKAVAKINGLRLENKVIKVSYARPSSETIKNANLYVANIPKNWTCKDLSDYFSQCGRIITTRILFSAPSNESGPVSKGVGFVRFDKRTEAEEAIKSLNGQTPVSGTEPLKVKFASHRVQSTSIVGEQDQVYNVPGIQEPNIVYNAPSYPIIQSLPYELLIQNQMLLADPRINLPSHLP